MELVIIIIIIIIVVIIIIIILSQQVVDYNLYLKFYMFNKVLSFIWPLWHLTDVTNFTFSQVSFPLIVLVVGFGVN